MNDLEQAKALFVSGAHTLVLCRGDRVVSSHERGVKPMLGFIETGVDLNGFSAADKVVGKAAAMLFVLAGVRAVYAGVMSSGAKAVLERHGVASFYDVLTETIINRAGTDICPMEQACAGVDTPQQALAAIQKRMKQLGSVKS